MKNAGLRLRRRRGTNLRNISIALMVPAIMVLLAPFARALTITVNTTSDTASTGHCTLREAIANANAGAKVATIPANSCGSGAVGLNTIAFSVSGTINISTNGTLTVTGSNHLTINGAGRSIAVSGGSKVQVLMVVSGATLTVANLIIENGKTAGDGGGIQNSGTLAVQGGVTFSGNKAADGGAIYNTSVLNVNTTAVNTANNFTNNSATSDGGAIYNSATLGATLNVTGSNFTNNSATSDGGAIYSEGTNFGVSGSNFTNNSASDAGGAIYNNTSDTVQLSGSTFATNTATNQGGAIYNNSGLVVTGDTFSGNSAGEQGGAVFNNGESFDLYASTFTGNKQTGTAASDYGGGAIYTTEGATVGGATSAAGLGNTFSGNTATSNGGAIYADVGGTTTVINSTFSGNSAKFSGGGICTFQSVTVSIENSTFADNTGGSSGGSGGGVSNNGSASLTLTGSILAGMVAGGNCGGGVAVTDGGYNISDDATCPTTSGTSQDGVNPELSAAGLQNNGGPTETIALQSTSPAIAQIPKGTSDTACLSSNGVDQRGAKRPGFGSPAKTQCDIGAFETGGAAAGVVNTTADPSTPPLPSTGTCTLREAVANATNPGTDMSDGNCQINNGSTPITFSVTGTIKLTSSLGPLPTITDSVTINGPTSSPGIIISGGNSVGIFEVASGGSLSLNYLTLEDAFGDFGGAVENSGTLTINNCLLANNDSDIIGGAVYNEGTATLNNSTFYENQAGFGEGNAIFDDEGSTTTITNCTISDNGTFGQGALWEYFSESLTMANTILSSNFGGNCFIEVDTPPFTFSNNGYNISDDATCGLGTSTGANSATLGDNVNPLIVGLGNNGGPTETISLHAASPAIDAVPEGQPNCPGIDQTGASRPDDSESACDIGALENP